MLAPYEIIADTGPWNGPGSVRRFSLIWNFHWFDRPSCLNLACEFLSVLLQLMVLPELEVAQFAGGHEKAWLLLRSSCVCRLIPVAAVKTSGGMQWCR